MLRKTSTIKQLLKSGVKTVKQQKIKTSFAAVAPFHSNAALTRQANHRMPNLNIGGLMQYDARGAIYYLDSQKFRALRLNNYRHQNRLDSSLSKDLMQAFRQAAANNWLQLLVFTSSGGQFFSAGHDIYESFGFYQKGEMGNAAQTLRDYIKCAYYIATNDKVTATFVDGQLMSGGGVLALSSDYTVITNDVGYSAPQLSYGAVFSGGDTHILTKIDKRFPGMGMFLGLTGSRIWGDDLIHCKLATHKSESVLGVEEALHENFYVQMKKIDTEKAHDLLSYVLPHFTLKPLSFQKDLPFFEKFFHNKKSIEDVIEGLSNSDLVMAQDCVKALRKTSPTALKVGFKMLKEAIDGSLDLDACMHMEYRANVHMMHHPDWAEGVLKTFVEPEMAVPNWSPATLDKVDMAFVDACLDEPLSAEKHQTCDIHLPHEVYQDEYMRQQIVKTLEKGCVTIMDE